MNASPTDHGKPAERHRLSAIMFTDMVGYSRLMSDDERSALALLSEHDTLIRDKIVASGGRVIKTIGDSFLADFDTATAAVRCAVSIQEILADRNREATGPDIHVRIGIHVGDVFYRNEDVFGDGVNVASRIMSEAAGDQILVSAEVTAITGTKLPYRYADRGKRTLKNIREPVQLFEVCYGESRHATSTATMEPGRESVPTDIARSPGSTPSRRILLSMLAGIAVIAAIAVALVVNTKRSSDSSAATNRSPRPALAVVGIADDAGVDEPGGVRMGAIIGDAITQRFYEFPHVRLVSPIQVARIRKELGAGDPEIARDESLVEQIGLAVDGQLLISGRLSRLENRLVLSAALNDITRPQPLLKSVVVSIESDNQILTSVVDSVCNEFQRRIADVFRVTANLRDLIPVGQLTTTSIEAYGHFINGYEMYLSGRIEEGIAALLKATELDPEFALAYSVIACAYYFAGDPEKSDQYVAAAARFRDRFSGASREALIFRGNLAWFEDNAEDVERNYGLLIDLYPDDFSGYLYFGLYLAYTKNDPTSAISYFEKAVALHPEWFPSYREAAYALKETQGIEAAVAYLQDYIRAYPEQQGASFARETIVTLRDAQQTAS